MIEPVEVEWLAWVLGDSMTRGLLGHHAPGIEQVAHAAEEQIRADLERTAALPAQLRNAHSMREQYGFDAATLPGRLRALDPDGQAGVLAQVDQRMERDDG